MKGSITLVDVILQNIISMLTTYDDVKLACPNCHSGVDTLGYIKDGMFKVWHVRSQEVTDSFLRDREFICNRCEIASTFIRFELGGLSLR